MKTIRRSIVIDAPAKRVFELVDDPSRYPDFFVGITKWEPRSRKRRGTGAKYRVLMQVGRSEATVTTGVRGLTADELVTIRSYPGYEADTLVKAPGENTFTSLQNLGTKRPARPDGSFELQLNDQIYMGDPDGVMYYLSGDPTAQGSYLVLELINKS